jgi:site-specific DNA-methyltransferase (adenine-specific)
MNEANNLQTPTQPPLVIADVSRCPSINFFNIDCIEFMKSKPDKCYDLAIVDVPYGLGFDGGNIGGNNRGKSKKYTQKDWDKEAPSEVYFKELQRVSKNQIIFGANHFISKIPIDSSCWIVWDKQTGGNFADCELAWTSFNTAVRKYTYTWNGFRQGKSCQVVETRIHPTQKPRFLYQWILQNYAKPNDKILDTHGGSMSIAIACDIEGFDLDICEIDKEYFQAGVNAFNLHKRQMRLF